MGRGAYRSESKDDHSSTVPPSTTPAPPTSQAKEMARNAVNDSFDSRNGRGSKRPPPPPRKGTEPSVFAHD